MPVSKTRLARIYRGSARNIAMLARRLRSGELVAVPTETVYGLAANALDRAACEKIFRAKGRPFDDPLIVHLHSARQLNLICEPNAAALKLARRFWPGPLTLVLPKRAAVPDIVSAGRPTVAVRVPSHPLFRRLLKAANLPLAAPSANPFGYVSPTTAEHVRDGLGRRISHILDGGAARIGLESTIVDLRDPAKPRILRPGAITREAISAALRQKVGLRRTRERGSPKPKGEIAPGMLARHYSPRTPLLLHRVLPPARNARHAYAYMARPNQPRGPNVFWLDERGDLRGAARRLFAMLRAMDAAGFDVLHAELAPEEGIGIAINDRLRRAAARG